MTTEEVRLFDAPDLAAIQRNWPRIALRASILVLVPFCVTMLAKSLDLYPVIASLPLPLDFLAQGPFAYEGKVVFAIVATLLALAFLVPKRTPQLVIAVCVGGILWAGHVYISLQWARLFAQQFSFRRDSAPSSLAWTFATILLVAGVLFLLLENLLDTREQQESRKLSKDETRAAFDLGARTLGVMVGLGAAMAATLVGAYLLLRASLADARLPFRLNPVFVLFGMGLALAVLLALAARKRSPTDWVAPRAMPAAAAAATPAPTAAASAALLPTPAPSAPKLGVYARMTKLERLACALALAALPILVLPWTSIPVGIGGGRSLGLETTAGAMLLIPIVGTLLTYGLARRNAFHRFGVPALWGLALFQHVETIDRATRAVHVIEFGAYLGMAVGLAALATTVVAARRNRAGGRPQA